MTREKFFGCWLPMEAPKDGYFDIVTFDSTNDEFVTYYGVIGITPVAKDRISIHYKRNDRSWCAINVSDIVAIDIYKKKGKKR